MPHSPDHMHDGADAARSGMPTGQRTTVGWGPNTKNSMPRDKTVDGRMSIPDQLDEAKSKASYLAKTRLQHPGSEGLDGPYSRTTNPLGSISPAIKDFRNTRDDSPTNMYSFNLTGSPGGSKSGDLAFKRIDPGNDELGTLNARVDKKVVTKKVADPDAKRHKMGKKKGQPKTGDGTKIVAEDRYIPSVVRTKKGETAMDRDNKTHTDADESTVNNVLRGGTETGWGAKRTGFRTQKRAEIAAEAMGKRRMEGRDAKTGRKPNFSGKTGKRVGETY